MKHLLFATSVAFLAAVAWPAHSQIKNETTGSAAPAVQDIPPFVASDLVKPFAIGTYQAAALSDGELSVPNDNKTLATNQKKAQVDALLKANNLQTDQIHLSVQPLIVRTYDSRVLLFDTGAGSLFGPTLGKLPASLAAAGVDPSSVTDIYISHGHGDHVGGLVTNNKLTFPNAAIHIQAAEWNSLKRQTQMASLVTVIAPKVVEFQPGAYLPPVNAVDIKGHTPGHSGFFIMNGNYSLLYIGDTMHHSVISVQKPDWTIAYDADAPVAQASRKQILESSVARHQRIYAVHFPFPGLGKFEKQGDKFTWVAEQERFRLEWEPDCLDSSVASLLEKLCSTNTLGTKELVIERLKDLYSNGRYDALERALKLLVESKRRCYGGESAEEAISDAFSGYTAQFSQWRSAEWRTKMPTSYFAYYATARAAYDSAWAIRGRGMASSVSEESWRIFFVRLNEAERLLNEAPPELKSIPIWHTLMFDVLVESSKNADRAEEVFRNAVERWPRNFELYKYRLVRLIPKWGGSWQLVDTSIQRWSERLKKTEGSSLYARLYIDLLDLDALTPERTGMSWTLMKDSFEDLVRLYPYGEFRLRYAAYACAARDKPAYLKALGSVRLNHDEEPIFRPLWLSGNSMEACMIWAGQCSDIGPCLLHPPK